MIPELEPVVHTMEETRARLLHLLEHVPEDLLRVPFPGRTWSAKDTLAHLTANEALMSEVAEGIATGSGPRLPADFDNDRFNAETVAARRDKSVAEILEELAHSRRHLLEFLSAVTREQLSRRGDHPLAGHLNLREFLTVMYAHEVTHSQEIAEHVYRLMATSRARPPAPAAN